MYNKIKNKQNVRIKKDERGASGCRRRRQTGAPSELRSKTSLVSCQMGVSWVLLGLGLGANF